MIRRFPLVLAAGVGLVLSLSPRQASAGDPPASESTPDKEAEAIERYEKGRALYKQGDWDAALAEFTASRHLHPTWPATASAALSLKQLKRNDEALDMFEELLRTFANELSAGAKEQVQREVVALRAVTGTLEIDGAEPGAAITIDGRSRGEYPPLSPLRVLAGSHLVRVAKEGFEPFEQRAEVAGDRSERVTARMIALARSGKLRVAEQGGRALEVVIDGSAAGKTPWEGRLGAGDHVVLLRGDGDLGTPPVTVAVEVDRTTPLTLEAERLAARLRVEPVPVNASVAVDSVTVGRGIWEGRLRAGAHRIEIAAPGFVPETRAVTLVNGAREVMKAALSRDESSPFWRKPPRASRWVAELGAAAMIVPTFGGDVAGACTGACEQGPGAGGTFALHAGYELGIGIGFGVTIGFLSAEQTTSGRRASVVPVGLDPNAGTADDRLALRGALAGGWLGFSLGERFPLHFRLGAGALIGAILDERAGMFRTGGGAFYRLGPAIEQHDARYVYVTPEVRLALPLSRHVEVSAGVAVPVLFSLEQPRWSEAHVVPVGSDGLGTFEAEALTGAVLLAVAPGFGVRYDF